MSSLHETIDRLLAERGITGGKMCSDLGMSRSFMTELRKGRAKSIKAETAQKIADYLGVTMNELLDTEQKESPAANCDEAAVPHAKYRDVLQQDGIRLLLDADAKVSQEDLDDIVEFIKFKRRKSEY